LEGHKLASLLSKTKNIAITLIPDSNIYAIMARVNKVIFTPVAVMADGGAICSSGHLMVASAAKEHAVPVVGLASAFMLSPLFAHNQETVLNQLKSPEGVIPYDAPVDLTGKVEITLPAYDFVPPGDIILY
jgi:translation initiation factor eIF-2B subunit beta